MRKKIRSRRRILQVLGATSAGLLAGCSTSSSEEQTLANKSSTILNRLPQFADDEFKGDVITVRSLIPRQLAGYRDTRVRLQSLDKAVPLSFDIDIASVAEGYVALDRTIVSLTAAGDESVSGSITDPGAEVGSIGSYTVYDNSEGLLALDGDRLLFTRPDDRVTISTREVLERVIDAERKDSERTSTDRQKAAAETVEAADADHFLSVAVPFNRDVFGDSTTFASGARAFVWGITVDGNDSGTASVRSIVAARFPVGKANEDVFFSSVYENYPDKIDPSTISVDGDVVTAYRETESEPYREENSYLRPRGLSDAVFVLVRAYEQEWKFDYPNHGITGTEELVLPVDRTAVVGAKSTDGIPHYLAVPPLELKVKAEPPATQYGTVTPSKTGDFLLYCNYPHEGSVDHTARARVVDTATFEQWLSSQ